MPINTTTIYVCDYCGESSEKPDGWMFASIVCDGANPARPVHLNGTFCPTCVKKYGRNDLINFMLKKDGE